MELIKDFFFSSPSFGNQKAVMRLNEQGHMHVCVGSRPRRGRQRKQGVSLDGAAALAKVENKNS